MLIKGARAFIMDHRYDADPYSTASGLQTTHKEASVREQDSDSFCQLDMWYKVHISHCLMGRVIMGSY